METRYRISAVALAGSMIVLMIHPDIATALAFTAGCTLFGVLHWIDRDRQLRFDALREDLEKQTRALKDRIDGLVLQRGMHR